MVKSYDPVISVIGGSAGMLVSSVLPYHPSPSQTCISKGFIFVSLSKS